jgi:hypothetical protein
METPPKGGMSKLVRFVFAPPINTKTNIGENGSKHPLRYICRLPDKLTPPFFFFLLPPIHSEVVFVLCLLNTIFANRKE